MSIVSGGRQVASCVVEHGRCLPNETKGAPKGSGFTVYKETGFFYKFLKRFFPEKLHDNLKIEANGKTYYVNKKSLDNFIDNNKNQASTLPKEADLATQLSSFRSDAVSKVKKDKPTKGEGVGEKLKIAGRKDGNSDREALSFKQKQQKELLSAAALYDGSNVVGKVGEHVVEKKDKRPSLVKPDLKEPIEEGSSKVESSDSPQELPREQFNPIVFDNFCKSLMNKIDRRDGGFDLPQGNTNNYKLNILMQALASEVPKRTKSGDSSVAEVIKGVGEELQRDSRLKGQNESDLYGKLGEFVSQKWEESQKK